MRYFKFVVGVDIPEIASDEIIDAEDVIAHAIEDVIAQAIYENFGWDVVVDYHR